jgi:hypothetical protein
MTHFFRTTPLLSALLAASCSVHAQEATPEPPEPLLAAAEAAGADGQRVIKAAPYCADAVHETVQWLADGNGAAPNRIVRQQTTRLCRDGEGRTRQEVERSGRKLVYLRDPAARETWLLDPERKSARRIGSSLRMEWHSGESHKAMREYAERLREWARHMAEATRGGFSSPTPPTPPTLPTPPTPPTPATPTTPSTVIISRADDPTQPAEVRLLRSQVHNLVDWAIPAPVQWRALNMAPRGAGSTSPLPAKEIDGLRVNGERTSWLIEAGKLGNEKPIQITREVWTSPELMLTVASRDFDPRSGEVNYRLKNLKRGEPDPALMKVPADYTQPARQAPKAPSN